MSTKWVMPTTQEHLNRVGKVPQEYAESASSYVKWQRWKSADSSHYICLIGYFASDEAKNLFNEEREFHLYDEIEEFVIQIHRPPNATPSPGYTNIAVRLERGEDGSVVQHEASSSSSDSYPVLAIGMCITVSRRDCEAADSATVQHHPRVKSKGLCYKMPGFEMELLGDLVLADGLSDGEGLLGQTLNFKIIDDEDDDFCIRITRTKNSTSNGSWTAVKSTVSPSENTESNNLVGESYIGATTYILEFVVQHHGLSEESSNVGADDDTEEQDSYERDTSDLEYQMQLNALNIQQKYLDQQIISNRRQGITMMRIVGEGCKCCEENGCWDESCNRAKCRSGCNCW